MTKKKTNQKDVSDFTVDATLSMTQRIASFLDWAAINRPKEYMAFNVILKAIMGYKHLPRLESNEVAFVKKANSRVRKVLLEKYKRGLDSQRGLGIRATVDDADMVKTDVAAKGQRVQSAVNSFTASVNVVNPANLPNTPEMKPYLGYIKDAKKIVATFQTPEFIRALLPPKKDDKSEG